MRSMKEQPRHFRIDQAEVITPINHDQLRTELQQFLVDFITINPNIIYAEAIGSTATGTETQYSDKDIGIVVKDDHTFNQLLSQAEQFYGRYPRLVDWYAYNPFHHYVVYDALEGPVPLDIYYLTESQYFLITHPSTRVIDMALNKKEGEELQHDQIIDTLCSVGYQAIEQAERLVQVGNYESALRVIKEYLENKLITLLSLITGQEIPHIKKIDFKTLDPEIVMALRACFGPPTRESLLQSVQSMRNLLHMVKAFPVKPLSSSRTTFSIRTGATISPSTSQLGEAITTHPAIKKILWNESVNAFGVVVNDDDQLLRLANELETLLKNNHMIDRVVRMSPVHWRFLVTSTESTGTWNDIYLTNIAHYQNIKKKNVALKNTGHPFTYGSETSEGEPYQEYVRKQTDQEFYQMQIVKAMIRTFRLLSKVVKEEWMTAGYIVSAIRNDQVIPLLTQTFGDSVPEQLTELLLMTYPQPERTQTLQSIRALSQVIAEIYEQQRQKYDLHQIEQFMQHALRGIADFDYYEGN